MMAKEKKRIFSDVARVTEFIQADSMLKQYGLFLRTKKSKFSVSSPPGEIEKRVFIGGNYILMPVLREIEKVVKELGFVPIIAYDFDISRDKTRDYTLRLAAQCKRQIFDITLSGGEIVEIEKCLSFTSSSEDILLVYMSIDEDRSPPPTVSMMTSQVEPSAQGYLTIDELKEIVTAFLSKQEVQEEAK